MTTTLPSHNYKCSKAFYAKKYNRSLPTIKKYMDQGLPLDDDIAMVVHLEARNEFITGGGGPYVPTAPEEPSAPEVPEKRTEDPPRGAPPPTPGGARGRSEATLKAEKAAVDLEIARHKLSVMRGDVVDRVKVREAGVAIGAILDAELASVEQEIPGVCAGLSEIELKTKLPQFFLRVRKNIKEQLLKHLEEKPDAKSAD